MWLYLRDPLHEALLAVSSYLKYEVLGDEDGDGDGDGDATKR